LNLRETTTFLPNSVFAGQVIDRSSSFDSRNQFYGGQIGTEAEYRYGPWFLNLRGKLALGSTHETVMIAGSTTSTSPLGTPSTIGAGPFALPSNIGRFSRDQFSVVPEFGLNIGWQATPNIRLTAGYTLIYWTDVLRAGEQVDR